MKGGYVMASKNIKKAVIAKKIIRQVKRNNARFIEEFKKEKPIIEAMTTIKPEKGLRKFNI